MFDSEKESVQYDEKGSHSTVISFIVTGEGQTNVTLKLLVSRLQFTG